MTEERVRRRLVAILAADMVGYSRLMAADEEGTLARLRKLRADLIDPKIAEYGGRIFKTTGDGLLAEFPSAVEAVRHAVEFQNAMTALNGDLPETERIVFRIGISLGDVMVDGDDLFGNGVNVAARMEGLADAGGICVSGNVQEHVCNSLDFALEDLGDQNVKNIDRPVRCYRVQLKPERTKDTSPLPAPDKPSIAVLPFGNISGDPEQEYFADGITEDLITALSHIRQFLVTARNTTFTYKGDAVDIQSVARELGVKYVVEGSVRKAGNRARVSVQLIDGETGNQIWAERYDRELEDIFALQDELSLTLAAAIEPELAKAERDRAAGKKPENLDAWDCYQRGMSLWQTMKKDQIAEARSFFEQAIERDPKFAPAYAGFAMTSFLDTRLGFTRGDKDKATRAARRAVELDGEDAQSHLALGMIYYVDRNMGAAANEFEFAIRLNPSFVLARVMLGRALTGTGNAEEAVPHIEQALHLSPRDPVVGPTHAALGRAHLCLRNYDEAIKWATIGQRYQNTGWPMPMILASCFGHLGDRNRAQSAVKEMDRLQPGITIEFVQTHLPISHREYMEHILDGLREAGLPE